MLWYIMDVYTSYIIGITKKHNFYLITHTGTLEIQFFKEIGGNMVRIVFRKNYFKSQLLLESAAKTIRDTIMIFSTVYPWVEISKKQFLFYVNRMKNKKVSL